MTRAYISFVALFFLPLLVFFWLMDYAVRTPPSPGNSALDVLRLLAAWSAMSGSYHGFWSDWGWLIFLLIIGVVATSIFDRLAVRTSRNLFAAIIGSLDERGIGVPDSVRSLHWQESFINASASGHVHGRPVTATLRYTYGCKFNHNWLEIELVCRSRLMFEIRTRKAAARLMALFGQQQMLSGDAELDGHLLLVAYDPAFKNWITGPEIRQKILALIIGHNATSISADPNSKVLRLRFEPFYLLWGSLLLEDLPSILKDMGVLADSLDPSDRARPGPRAATSPEPDYPHADAAVHLQAAVEQTYEPQNVLAAGSQRVSRGLYEPPLSSPILGDRLVGTMLILTGIVLLSGVPGTLVVSIAPQNHIVMWFAVLVPLLGLGTLVAGVITYQRWRRSDREFREKILASLK